MSYHISIDWYIEDVQSIDETLTDKQAEQVLDLVKYNHDATIGVNWDVIRIYIDMVRGAK